MNLDYIRSKQETQEVIKEAYALRDAAASSGRSNTKEYLASMRRLKVLCEHFVLSSQIIEGKVQSDLNKIFKDEQIDFYKLKKINRSTMNKEEIRRLSIARAEETWPELY